MPYSSGSDTSSSSDSTADYASEQTSSINRGIFRMSKTFFEGSMKYQYTDRNGLTKEIYVNEAPPKLKLGSFLRKQLFLVPFFAVGILIIILWIGLFFAPKPLVPEYTIPNEMIIDQENVLESDSGLPQVLTEFRQATGICPVILTVTDSTWNKEYKSLQSYAYSYYTDHYQDEQHFLLVYSISVPMNEKVNQRAWSLEGMQGNDTGTIIRKEYYDRFYEDYRNDIVLNGYSPTHAFTTAFQNSFDYIMKPQGFSSNIPLFFAMIVWNAIIIYFLYRNIKHYLFFKKDFIRADK